MRTIRRLYFYTLTLISIEVVTWGIVGLLRTIFSSGLVGGGSLLATGLSFVLVGLPIFWLHWRTVQRDAGQDLEERSSRVRAVFLYAVLFAALAPFLYAVLALLDRGLVSLLGQPASDAWFGGQQNAADNLIAAIVNTVLFLYFWQILRADWQAGFAEGHLRETRRLYRYLWVLAGLAFSISGVYNLIRYIFEAPSSQPGTAVPTLAGGIALLLVGAPLWYFFWQTIEGSLEQPAERHSLLRLVTLYLISLAGVLGVLTSVGSLLNALLRWILAEPQTVTGFLQANSSSIGAAIPLGMMWWYYGRILGREVATQPDQPRRAALRRLYDTILAALGLAVTLAGLLNLVSFLAELAFTPNQLIGSFQALLSGALSALMVGLPLWLIPWRIVQAEAAQRNEAGDHARRSVVRKAYLYLVLFFLVIGGMVFTGRLLYTLLNALFSQTSATTGLDASTLFLSLVIDVVFLIYHWRALRRDGQVAQQTLGNLHADFPTLILTEDDNQLTDAIVTALQRVAPRLPVAVRSIARGAPDETLLGAKAILIPLDLAIHPPEPLRLWLNDYPGRRVILPQSSQGWEWLGVGGKGAPDLAEQAARTVRQMAEGEAVRPAQPASPWMVAGYALGGLFGLQLLGAIFAVMISALFR